jgi:hypothetical protein
MTRGGRILLSTVLAALAAAAPAAEADVVFQHSFGAAGAGAGRFSTPAGLAIDSSNGDVYVVDSGQNRVEQFTSSPSAETFVRAWGYDVVASGVDNKPLANEVDEVRIRATSGSFALSFGGQETVQLDYDASAAEVQGALNGLPTISPASVTVTGGPGNTSGSTPYVVTFNGGALAAKNVELGIEPSGLGGC